jgi:carboxyl-terminal processing protease
MKNLISLTLILLFAVACEQATATPTPTPTMSPEATAYLEEALNILQENSYYSSQVDWDELRPRVYSYVAGAQFPDETYRAIESAINALNDRHANFYDPEQVAGMFQSSSIGMGMLPEGKTIADRLGYIMIPGFMSGEEADLVKFATDLQTIIQTLDESNPCGWIIDLQENSGGNMWPMLAGIGPVLGEGTAGAFVDTDGAMIYWSYDNGRAYHNEYAGLSVAEPYLLRQGMPPVAVLTSSQTASSGEAIVIAFRGRPDTRSFGQATAGYASAVQWFPLSDGAWIGLTTAMFADRTGQIYNLVITPDEITSPGEEIPQAAIDWLLAQPACNTP